MSHNETFENTELCTVQRGLIVRFAATDVVRSIANSSASRGGGVTVCYAVMRLQVGSTSRWTHVQTLSYK
jgi:hypothetical protein